MEIARSATAATKQETKVPCMLSLIDVGIHSRDVGMFTLATYGVRFQDLTPVSESKDLTDPQKRRS